MSYRTATMCLAAILLLAGAIHPSWAATDLNSIVEFDIPAGPLPGALLKYSQQSGIQVTSAADVVDRKQSPGVKGPYPAAKALTQLLLGTQLEFDTVNPSTVSIRRESRSSSTRDGRQSAPMSASGAVAPSTTSAAGSSSAAADRPTGALEEIVVTARRKEERA